MKRISVLAVLLLVSAVICPKAYAETLGAELIKNGGLEQWTSSGPENWLVTADGASGVIKDTAVFHSGSASARISVDANRSFVTLNGGNLQAFTEAGGRKYRLSFWVKGEKGGEDSYVLIAGEIDKSTTRYLAGYYNVTKNEQRIEPEWSDWGKNVRVYSIKPDWTKVEFDFTVPSNVKKLVIERVGARQSGIANQTYWIDDISLKEVVAP